VGDGFELAAGELTAHGGHVDGLSDRLDTTLDAARVTSMGDEAYGLLCAFVPAVVNPMEARAVDALRAAVDGLRATAEHVRTTARQYTERDEANAQPFLRATGRTSGRTTGRTMERTTE
jgi:excreted virulence factor EspC (type VII ESX diderm)